jgi:hypothetical protein
MSRPSSGQWVGGGFGGSRGGSAGPDVDRSLKHHFPFGSSLVRRRAAGPERVSQLVTRRAPSVQWQHLRRQWLPRGFHAVVARRQARPARRRTSAFPGDTADGRYWARTSDLLLVSSTPGVIVGRHCSPKPANRESSPAGDPSCMAVVSGKCFPRAFPVAQLLAPLVVRAAAGGGAKHRPEGGVKIPPRGVGVLPSTEQMDVYVPGRLGARVTELL